MQHHQEEGTGHNEYVKQPAACTERPYCEVRQRGGVIVYEVNEKTQVDGSVVKFVEMMQGEN